MGASPLLFLASRPFLYEEALLWGAAFASAALGAAMASFLPPRRWTLVVLVLADALAMLSRPTVAVSGLLATLVGR